ncbi:MAG TPA: hypothetical protein VIE89_16995 [Candidatus Binatia bacterium]|jgi:hypothetical protein
MAQFVINQTIETAESEIEVTVNPQAPLPVGRQRFQLVVVDDSGNVSEPDVVEVIVKDTLKPTAVLQAPREVNFGQSFQLSGKQSSDIGGKIVRYRWTLLPRR